MVEDHIEVLGVSSSEIMVENYLLLLFRSTPSGPKMLVHCFVQLITHWAFEMKGK